LIDVVLFFPPQNLHFQKKVVFSAEVFIEKPLIYHVLMSYDNVKCNLGGHFDQKSGIFKAPFDGTYMACITLVSLGYKKRQEWKLYVVINLPL
jgi:hypothetical protein